MGISLPKRGKFLRYWLPLLLWCGVMLSLSGDLGSSNNTESILHWLLPNLSLGTFDLLHLYLRKGVGHVFDYGFLYFLWFRAFRGGLGYRGGRAFLCSLGPCLAVALLDEGHQSLLASRSGSLSDVGLDLAAPCGAALILTIFQTLRPKADSGAEA
ncbi:MAG: VanZ family protein [Desulfobaccales bacterium]